MLFSSPRYAVLAGVLAAGSLLASVAFAQSRFAKPLQPPGRAGLPHAAAPERAPARAPFHGLPPAGTPTEAAGEVLVRLAAGASPEQIAAATGLRIKKRLLYAPRTYLFDNVHGPVDQAAQQLMQVPGVVLATPNRYCFPLALPAIDSNDPLRNLQWALPLVGSRDVWGINVGERLIGGPRQTAVVGLVDFGPQTSHPDLAENFDLANGFDFRLNQPYNENANTLLLLEDHGTQMSGCIAAVTNNAEGIAGLPWEGVRILPCHVGDVIVVNNVLVPVIPISLAVDAIYYCIEQQVDVINMSFGTLFPDPLLGQACRDAYNEGIVLVGATGNFARGTFSLGVLYPAKFPEVIAVGAVGPSGEKADYSDWDTRQITVELMAPGGNDTFGGDIRRLIVVPGNATFLFPELPPGYVASQGTSHAAAYVSGCIATLITQGLEEQLAFLAPDQRVEAIRRLLRETARNPFGRPTDQYGYGLIDLGAALRRITHFIDVFAPGPNEVTASFAEPLEAQIVQPVPSLLSPGSFSVRQNGVDVTSRVQVTDPAFGLLSYEPDLVTRYAIGVNEIDIRARNALLPGDPNADRSLVGDPVGRIPRRAFRFRVQPRVEQPDRRMISIPYVLQPGRDTLDFVYGGNHVRLARWLPIEERYAIFDNLTSPQDPEAALLTTSAGVSSPPVGVGFWGRVVDSAIATQLQIMGRSIRAPFYEIPLQPGFNMIGNPYPFRIPWAVVNVRFGNQVMSLEEASRRNLMRNVIWRFRDGRYTFQAAPAGELIEWESHWVRSFEFLSLLVPRVPVITRDPVAAASPPASSRGWRAALRAGAGGRTGGEVLVGVATGARDGIGPEDVELPPANPGPVSLRIRNDGAPGAFLQDLRAVGGTRKRWTLELETRRAGVPVQLTWEGLPAAAQAAIRVEGGPSRRARGRSGSLEFVPQRAGVYRVTVETPAS